MSAIFSQYDGPYSGLIPDPDFNLNVCFLYSSSEGAVEAEQVLEKAQDARDEAAETEIDIGIFVDSLATKNDDGTSHLTVQVLDDESLEFVFDTLGNPEAVLDLEL